MQVFKCFPAKEFSTDFMARCRLAFDQRDAPPLARKRNRSSAARHSATEDEDFVLQRILIEDCDCSLLVSSRFLNRTVHPKGSAFGSAAALDAYKNPLITALFRRNVSDYR